MNPPNEEPYGSQYPWDHEMFYEMAKAAFRNFKNEYRGQVDNEKRKKLRANEQANRRAARRKEVSHSGCLLFECSPRLSRRLITC